MRRRRPDSRWYADLNDQYGAEPPNYPLPSDDATEHLSPPARPADPPTVTALAPSTPADAATATDWLLYARDLTKSFGATRVLDRLSLGLAPGTILGLVGPNGAGKTTLLQILSGIIPPDSGGIWIGGAWVDFDRNPEARRGLGLMLGGRMLIEDLRAGEYFDFIAAMYGAGPHAATVAGMVTRLRLDEHLSKPIKSLSAGTKKKVEFVAAVLHRPRVLLFDEPFEALDPPSVRDLTEVTRAYVEAEGAAAVISSHIVPYVRPLATEVRLLWKGTLCQVEDVARLLTERPGDGELQAWADVLEGI